MCIVSVTSKEGNSEIYVICINFDKNKNIGDLLKKMSAVFNEYYNY